MADGSEADRRRRDSVYEHEQMVPEQLLHDLAQAPLVDETTIGAHQGSLSPAEMEVVKYLSHGYSFQMIADTLHKSKHTIRRQAISGRAAVNAKTTEHLVAIALRAGLID